MHVAVFPEPLEEAFTGATAAGDGEGIYAAKSISEEPKCFHRNLLC